MENVKNLSTFLKDIALKLYKLKVLDDIDYNEFVNGINNNNENDLYKYACLFLKRSLYNNVYVNLRNEFEGIKLIAYQSIQNFSKLDDFKLALKKRFSSYKFSVLFDSFFENDIITDRLKIYVPIDKKDNVLFELYSMQADIYENIKYQKNVHSDIFAVFNGKLLLDIYLYDISKEGNLTIRKCFVDNQKINVVETEILSSGISLCFKDYENNSKIETLEFAFINAIDGDSAVDFINAMSLKNIINLKKIDSLRLKIYHKTIEEGKSNGLQKIS